MINQVVYEIMVAQGSGFLYFYLILPALLSAPAKYMHVVRNPKFHGTLLQLAGTCRYILPWREVYYFCVAGFASLEGTGLICHKINLYFLLPYDDLNSLDTDGKCGSKLK